jgi:CHAT domain-containing protein
LPAAKREIASLVAMWGAGAVVTDAKVGSVRTLNAMSTATLVHYAGHAMLDRQRPDRSYLFLGSSADSMITGTAIASRRFAHSPLVILGACDTGGGTDGGFGGFDSLAGAFLDAGASRVIATAWPVDDAPTGQLMSLLHAALRDGQTPTAALRSAQLKALQSRDPTLNTPRVWAAFHIVGSARGAR